MKAYRVKRNRLLQGVNVLACLGVLTLLRGCGNACLFGECSNTGGVTAVINVTTANPQTCGPVNLDGSASSGSNLTFTWALTSQPAGSSAALTSTGNASTSFTPDVSNPNDDTYTVELTVQDGQGNQNSTTDPIVVAELPFADPGSDQIVAPGTMVTLDGSNSGNPESGCTNSNLNSLAGKPLV